MGKADRGNHPVQAEVERREDAGQHLDLSHGIESVDVNEVEFSELQEVFEFPGPFMTTSVRMLITPPIVAPGGSFSHPWAIVSTKGHYMISSRETRPTLSQHVCEREVVS
jgi:hypothetical protein